MYFKYEETVTRLQYIHVFCKTVSCQQRASRNLIPPAIPHNPGTITTKNTLMITKKDPAGCQVRHAKSTLLTDMNFSWG